MLRFLLLRAWVFPERRTTERDEVEAPLPATAALTVRNESEDAR